MESNEYGYYKKKEFNLSDFIVENRAIELIEDKSVIRTENVRKFIRLRDELEMLFHTNQINSREYVTRKNKLAGSKLNGTAEEEGK